MRSTPALAAALVVLAACSSGSTRAPTSTAATATTPTATTPTSTSTTTTTAASTSGPPASVAVTDLRGPTGPVECNAPTMVELRWTTRGAQTVEMHIDGGGVFATYADGAHDELLPLTCDGGLHTYRLVARAGGATASRTITVQTTRTG